MPARTRTLFISNIPWDFVWQRHQTLASLFAADSDVVFCEIPGVRRLRVRDLPRIISRAAALGAAADPPDLPRGLRVLRPFVLPSTNPLFHAANRFLIRRFIRSEPALRTGTDLIVNYSASRSALSLIKRVPHERLVYDCTDDWLAVRGIPACLPADERELLQRADLTLVPSRTLAARKAPFARRIERLPHGALVERFKSVPRIRAPQEPLSLLYYGHLHEQHFNFAAIDALARARPAWQIVLVGPSRTPHRFGANVTLAGQQPHDQLRSFIAKTDVLLLPYALNDYTRAVLPAKTYECLATGRPIVAAPLPELVQEFPTHMIFAEDPEQWASAVDRALESDSATSRAARVQVARENSWQQRYQRIRELLEAI